MTHNGTSKVRILAVGISLEFKIIEWRELLCISKSTSQFVTRRKLALFLLPIIKKVTKKR